MPTLEPHFVYGENAKFMGKENRLYTVRIGGLIFMGKKYGEKFFYVAYFRDRISTRDFPIFKGVTFRVRFFRQKNLQATVRPI